MANEIEPQEEAAKLSISREKLRERLARDVIVGSDAMERIGDEIAQAETVDDILSGGSVVHAEDILRVALSIRGFVLRPASDEFVKEGSESFAVMDCVVMEDTQYYARGEVIIVTCGGYNVQNALIRYAELVGEEDGLFSKPLVCAIKEAGRALRLYRPDHVTIEV